MGLYDIGVCVVLACFGLIGWVKGFSWQLVGVLTLLLCFTIAYPRSTSGGSYSASTLPRV